MRLEGRDVIVDITSHHIESALQRLLLPYTRLKDEAIMDGDSSLILVRLLKVGEEMPKNDAGYVDTTEMIRGLSGMRVAHRLRRRWG